jgi:hypothetical protein
MCNGKCASADKDERLTAILAGLANNPEFIRTIGYRYSSTKEHPSMTEIVTALKQIEELWNK